MDTAQVAEYLETTPRVLRQFLRSECSTFVAVGSGARYEFNEADLNTLRKRFEGWSAAGKPRPSKGKSDTPPPVVPSKSEREAQLMKDLKVWEEENEERRAKNKPSIADEMGDIRDPRVRARALADAQAAEDRLMLRLMSKGMHVLQKGDGATTSKGNL